MEAMKESIGFVGLGNMGQPMARNLLKAGYQLRMYNRDARKTEALVAEGAQRCLSPGDVVAPGGIVITMVSDDAALAPGVIGFILALGFSQFMYAGALPLIPFITIGWLCSAGLYYYRHRPNRSQAALNRNGGGEKLQEKGQEEAQAQDVSPAS